MEETEEIAITTAPYTLVLSDGSAKLMTVTQMII